MGQSNEKLLGITYQEFTEKIGLTLTFKKVKKKSTNISKYSRIQNEKCTIIIFEGKS